MKISIELLSPRKRLFLFIGLIMFLLLSGCGEENIAVSYLAVNHTDKPIDSITINDQGGILNVDAMGGGGKDVCCVTVPKTWRPGLTVKIGWEQGGHFLRDADGNFVMRNGDKVFIDGRWKFRTVPIPEYTAKQRQHFDIHFLPGDQVMVKLSDILPWHPDYRPAYPEEKKEAAR
ncbi:DUF3304 domain-containing protein [Chromobacterium phragmitis]|nr:DUF3304 domain-containing protein [Chromobacterium amazonense]